MQQAHPFGPLQALRTRRCRRSFRVWTHIGLHLAFLDPHNLGTLSFDLFEQLAKLKRVDVIAHVSLSDSQRNADSYTKEAHDQFDRLAPGWRDKVSTAMNQNAFRAAIIQYWCEKILEA